MLYWLKCIVVLVKVPTTDEIILKKKNMEKSLKWILLKTSVLNHIIYLTISLINNKKTVTKYLL